MQGPEPTGSQAPSSTLHIGGFRPVITPARGIRHRFRGRFRCLDAAADAAHMQAHEQNRKNAQNPKNLRLLRLRTGHRPGFRRRRPRLRQDSRQERHRPGLWRRRRRHDGRTGRTPCSRTAARSTGIIPEFLMAREHALQASARADRHPRHARAQTQDVRAGGRLRRAAGRRRHAGGDGRADDLGAARPPHASRCCSPISRDSGSRSARCSIT